MIKTFLFAAGLVFAGAAPSLADDVGYAYALCQMFDGTNLLSQPCEVSGWSSSVTVTVDMNSGEARNLCPMITNFLAQQNVSFEGPWTLQIKSPYSGDNSIAFCQL